MKNNKKLPTHCPHCGDLVNYLNHKHHLYMYCEENKTTLKESLIDKPSNIDEVPSELKKYLVDTFKNIAKGEGKLKSISQYGGSIFVTFDKNRTYRMTIQLYNSEITID
jgi:hypothetical protein